MTPFPKRRVRQFDFHAFLFYDERVHGVPSRHGGGRGTAERVPGAIETGDDDR
jgi:hypothetical protein